MTASIRAEVRKLRFTRSLWAVPATGLAIATIGAVLLVTVGEDAEIASRLSELGPLRFGSSNFGLLLLVFGVRIFADETQHQTLAATFVRTPDRNRVLAAKATVAAATSVLFCMAVYAVVVPVTMVGAQARGLTIAYDVGATVLLFGRVALAMVLLAVLGVALGAAFGNRTVAMVAVIVWFVLGEDLIGALLHLQRFLPGSAVGDLVRAAPSADALGAPAAALVLCGFVLAGVVAATALLRRDVA